VTIERSIPPFLTADVAKLGGALGPEPEDFVVEEIPAYAPSGQGEHLYVRVEKRRMTTRDAALALARTADVSERDVGYAGMKDKHGVTTQWFSLPRAAKDLEGRPLPPELRIVETSRHGNKLRTGHLRGNRFVLGMVGAGDGGLERARALLARLSDRGLLNAFGSQRFGRDGENLSTALAWLRGEHRLPRSRERFLSKLYSSAVQAEAFNRYAIARVGVGFDRLVLGEVVRLGGTGKLFVVEHPERELHRLLARDIVLTGPLPGPKLRPTATADGQKLEESVLSALGLGEAELSALAEHAPGTRRDLVVRPEHCEVRVDGDRLRISFELPAGSYATEVLREMLRSGAPETG
jgi:tRNA pseudouridine13 synthase